MYIESPTSLYSWYSKRALKTRSNIYKTYSIKMNIRYVKRKARKNILIMYKHLSTTVSRLHNEYNSYIMNNNKKKKEWAVFF